MAGGRAALALTAALALGGCGAGGGPSGPTGPGTQGALSPSQLTPAGSTTAPAVAPARAAGLPAQVPGRGSLTAYVMRPKVLRTAPGGRALATLRARTEFGSPRVVAVVARRGNWLGVIASELTNGSVGWIDAARGVELFRTRYALVALLSRRLLLVYRNGRAIGRVPVAVGRPSAPTPQGRFAVTDKLRVTDPGSPYGCCVLALSGHQPQVLQGWGGGDRIAIHATDSPQSIGYAASRGCLRAPAATMRFLVRAIPLGTQLRIRA